MKPASKEDVFKSLLTLAVHCPFSLRRTYTRSISRLGDELGSEVVRRIADEMNKTHR